MTTYFIRIFQFFRRRPAALFIFVVFSFAAFAWLGGRLKYEEDISKLLPAVNSGNAQIEGLAFSELRVKDRITVQICGATDGDELIDAAGRFADSLTLYDAADGDVGDILYEIEDEVRQRVMAYALENIPLLIEPERYAAIDSAISSENIVRQMAFNREKIASPEGSMFSRVMRYDPLNLRTAVFDVSNMEQLFGGNYILYGNQLFTTDTTVALLFVSPRFVSFDSKAGTRLVSKIERAAAQLKAAYPGLEILFHGPPVQSVFNSRQIKKDLALTVGVSLALACLLIIACFRRAAALPMLLAPVAYGAAFAMACMYLLQGSMSLMALGIGAIALGVAISYSLHVLVHSQYADDPTQILRHQTKPVIGGCLTTIGAFAGLLFTQSALLRDFGMFASLAMISTTVASLLFTPHLLSVVRRKNVNSQTKRRDAFAFLEKINSIPLDRNKPLLALITTAFVASLFFSSKVEFDANLRNIGYNEPDVVRSMALFAGKTSGGLTTGYYAAASTELDNALTLHREASRVCDSLQAAGKIRSYTRSSAILLPEAEQMKRIDAWKNYWSDARVDDLRRRLSEASAANGFKPAAFEPFFDMLAKDYKPASIYGAGVLPEGLEANMIERSQGMYLVYTAAQIDSADVAEVNGVMAAQNGIIVADPFYYAADRVRLMHRDFNTILGFSSLFVLLVLFVLFRNFAIAIIAFLPMAMSWYIVLGMMAAAGLPFNLINIVISTFIFGVGVDYSIFVMEGLLAGERGGDNLLAWHKTAIVLSAAVLVISVSSLLFARHPALSSIGVATIAGMVSTILITYALQPFLFRQWMRWTKKRAKA